MVSSDLAHMPDKERPLDDTNVGKWDTREPARQSHRTIPETPARCRLRRTHATQETKGRESLCPMDETEADRRKRSQRQSHCRVRGTLASKAEDPCEV